MFYRINDKMFNENLATLKSPDRQAKCMRIQFEIKENLKSATYWVSWDFACKTTKIHFIVHIPCITETS